MLSFSSAAVGILGIVGLYISGSLGSLGKVILAKAPLSLSLREGPAGTSAFFSSFFLSLDPSSRSGSSSSLFCSSSEVARGLLSSSDAYLSDVDPF